MKQEQPAPFDENALLKRQNFIASPDYTRYLTGCCRSYRSWGADPIDILNAVEHGQQVALLATFKPGVRSPKAYGRRAAINHIKRICLQRCKFRRYWVSARYTQPASSDAADRAVAHNNPMIDQILSAARSLDDEYGIPFIEHFKGNRSQTDIAKTLGVSKATVSRRIRRATVLIRRRLREAA